MRGSPKCRIAPAGQDERLLTNPGFRRYGRRRERVGGRERERQFKPSTAYYALTQREKKSLYELIEEDCQSSFFKRRYNCGSKVIGILYRKLCSGLSLQPSEAGMYRDMYETNFFCAETTKSRRGKWSIKVENSIGHPFKSDRTVRSLNAFK